MFPKATKKTIHIVSARKEKGGNGQMLNIEANASPQLTSKTPYDYPATINIKNQVTAAQFVSIETIANAPRSPRFTNIRRKTSSAIPYLTKVKHRHAWYLPLYIVYQTL